MADGLVGGHVVWLTATRAQHRRVKRWDVISKAPCGVLGCRGGWYGEQGKGERGGGTQVPNGYPLPNGRAERSSERQNIGAVNSFEGRKGGRSTSN